MLENFEKVLGPVQKLIELNKSQVEKMVAAQQEAAKSYVELTEARIKAAAEIKDQDALAAFVKDQVELAQSSYEKFVADSKALFADAKTYNEEVLKLVQEVNTKMTEEVKSAVEKATKG